MKHCVEGRSGGSRAPLLGRPLAHANAILAGTRMTMVLLPDQLYAAELRHDVRHQKCTGKEGSTKGVQQQIEYEHL